MGRTKRIRKKRQINREFEDFSNVFLLQKSIGLRCPKIKIGYFNETGRGIKCKKKIYQGDILIALPLYHLITINTHCDIFSILSFDNQTPQFILSVILVYEAHLKTESKYFNYIESSPKFYTNLYFCTKQEIQLLPDFIQREVVQQMTRLEYVIQDLFDGLNDKKCLHCGNALRSIFAEEKFIWAWFTVNTRSVYYKDEKEVKSLALAPFLDMFNHSDNANIEQFIDFDKKLYVLRTLVEYNKYDQVFIKYGPHSNLKLLLEYGFIVSENPHDFIEFTFQEVVESAKEVDLNFGELSKLKYNFIKSNHLNKNLTKSREFSWSLNGLIYVLITKEENLSLLQAKTYSNDFNMTETKLINKVGDVLIGKKLKEFRESLSEMETLKNSSKSFQLAKDLMKIYINLLQ